MKTLTVKPLLYSDYTVSPLIDSETTESYFHFKNGENGPQGDWLVAEMRTSPADDPGLVPSTRVPAHNAFWLPRAPGTQVLCKQAGKTLIRIKRSLKKYGK